MRVERPKKRKATKEEQAADRTAAQGPLVFTPHPGAQSTYFDLGERSAAKIIIAGGGAGGGKSTALTIEPLTGLAYPGFEAAIFRKTQEQHRMKGGLLAETQKWYDQIPDADLNKTSMDWRFSDRCAIKLCGCDDPKKYDGMQIAYLGVDQVEDLTAEEFWHLVSRVRTTCGYTPRIRATCNPEPGWLELFLKSGGYVSKDGFAIPEMDGVVQWFVRDPKSDVVVWRDTAEDFGTLNENGKLLDGKYKGLYPTSFAYVEFPLEQNKSLPPEYEANLQTMTIAERRKKLDRCWNVWEGGGLMYRAEWWGYVDDKVVPSTNRMAYLPPDIAKTIRMCWAWDIGWTALSDWTVGILFGQASSYWAILDMVKFRARESVTMEVIRRCLSLFGTDAPLVLPKDPGKAGVDQANWQLLYGQMGFEAHLVPDDGKTGDKVARHRFLSPQAEHGRLKLVTDWRPSAEVSLWVSQQTDEVTGRPVPCTTVDDWSRELVKALDALSHECTHEVTDIADAVARGHRFMTAEDPIGANAMAGLMRRATEWRPEEPRTQIAQRVVSQWSRQKPGSRQTTNAGNDVFFGGRRR